MKLKPYADSSGVTAGYLFWCPACNAPHPFRIRVTAGEPADAPCWTFNGDLGRPTFSPSLVLLPPCPPCHLFVREGRIEFCADAGHALAGQTVDIPDWDDDRQ